MKRSDIGYLIVSILFVIIIVLIFESAQQFYFVKRYQIIENPSFTEMLQQQSIRWFIWLVLAGSLIPFAKRKANSSILGGKVLIQYFLLSIGLMVLSVVIIAYVQLLMSSIPVNWRDYNEEFLPFFAFQKAPIYTLGFGALSGLLHFYFVNQQLQVEILELEEVRALNVQLYTQLSPSLSDHSRVLKIRIGKTQKIIPFEEINWIQADDYCSKVHLIAGKSYSMRLSLKSLEEKLGLPFVRVHRSAIVNMKQISEIKNGESCEVVLKNGTSVTVAKKRLKTIKSHFATDIVF